MGFLVSSAGMGEGGLESTCELSGTDERRRRRQAREDGGDYRVATRRKERESERGSPYGTVLYPSDSVHVIRPPKPTHSHLLSAFPASVRAGWNSLRIGQTGGEG